MRNKSKRLRMMRAVKAALPYTIALLSVCVSSAGSMKEAVTGWVDKSPSWVVDSPNRPVALFRSALTPPGGVEKHCIA